MRTVVKDRAWSRVGREIEHELTLLNDQFCFFLFLEHQFFDELPKPGTTAADRFTRDVFKGNRYASKINVRLRDLPSFRETHRSASFGAYFTNSYEIAASFADGALALLQEKSRVPLILPERVQEGPEIYYQRILRSWRYSLPAPRLIDTLSFLRHRRNALTHLHTAPSLPYTRFVRRCGNALNTFWTAARVHIDFTEASTRALAERETLDLLKLMRIVIQRLDAHFVSIIDVPGVVRAEAIRLFGDKRVRMNRYVATERIQKLHYEIMREFGVSPPEQRDWTIVREYVDKGISGAKERRPALDQLLADCRKRAVDCVVVYRYDRFARSLRQLVNALEDFRALGIDFVSLHESVDTSTPNGRLVFGIFASIAEFERELIRDRVRSGLALAKSHGKQLGRPRVVVDCIRVAGLRREGRSWTEICQMLGISKGTAQRAVLSLPKNLPEIASLNS